MEHEDGSTRTLWEMADLVFVVEKSGAGGESVRTGMDLRMLAYFGGRERGVTDLTALAREAGLRVVAVHAAGDTPVVELNCI
jgi:hypothetical protein